jgi:uncharacterized protein (TIGR03083 family)
MTISSASRVGVLCDELTAVRAQLSVVLRQITDPRPTAVGSWSIGETAQHLSGSAEYFLAAARGEADLERLDEIDASNARALAADPEREPRVLADRFDRGGEALVAFARTVGGDPSVTPFAGVEVPLSTLLGRELGEVLVHGRDIARAAGLPWHIDPSHAVLTLEAYLPLFPFLLDRHRAAGVRLALELRVRGMRPIIVRIEGGTLVVADSRGQRVDAHLSAEPVTYLLLTWARIAPWRPILRGQLVVWGRRPWRVGALGPLLLT